MIQSDSILFPQTNGWLELVIILLFYIKDFHFLCCEDTEWKTITDIATKVGIHYTKTPQKKN